LEWRAASSVKSEIVNVVGVAKVARSVDLKGLAFLSPRFKLETKPFSRAVYRRGGHVAYVFRTGKVRITGGRSERDARSFLDEVVHRLGRLKIELYDRPQLTITNFVSVFDIGTPLDMRKFEGRQSEGIDYEPEQFPGAICRLVSSKAVALAFNSGKVVLSGARSMSALRTAEREVVEILTS
jgi:transcription initiation factor TFIID TATA-box-binding protein